MAVTTVRLSPEVEQELSSIAERTQRSRSWLISRAVEQFIERDRRERERWNETLAAVESAANGNVIAADAVHDWLRGWGTPGETDGPGSGM